MTREEAIKWLEYSKEHYEGLDYGAPRIAVDMAISALREQEALARNSHDVASNEQVTEPLHCNGYRDPRESLVTKNQVTSDNCLEFEAVKGVEIDQFKTGLVSVKDKLPENDGDMFLVLVTGEYNNLRFNMAYELAYYYQDDGWCLEQYPLYEHPGVTHWMPLPEPPKGGAT